MRPLAFFFLLVCIVPALHAQEECTYFGEKASNDLMSALEKSPSCSAAADKLHRCEWGSSADARFAGVVISKCEKAFLASLPPPAKERYTEEMQLCAYRESRAEGTIHISEAAMCEVDVAADYAVHPQKAQDQPMPASFSCTAAKTPLETAICSRPALGQADIVLSRAYTDVLKSIPAKDRAALIQNEKDWLAMVPRKCGITSSPASGPSINCVRNEFELRFTNLDNCQPMEAGHQGDIVPCILDSFKSEHTP
jgi:uncharacterized protein YecT (DUF1311 family)